MAAQERPSFQRLWDPDIPNSVIALRDLAEAAAKVLDEREAHYLAQYPLCSTMPISDADIARVIGKLLGRAVEIQKPSLEQGIANTGTHSPSERGLAEGDPRPDIYQDAAERLVMFYNRRGLRGSPNVLRWLLGRQPTTVEKYVELELSN